jgi:hypothetical protein
MDVEKNHAELQARRDELERYLTAARAETWAEAVEKARYLLGLLAESPACQDPRRKLLVEATLADFERLLTANAGGRDHPN